MKNSILFILFPLLSFSQYFSSQSGIPFNSLSQSNYGSAFIGLSNSFTPDIINTNISGKSNLFVNTSSAFQASNQIPFVTGSGFGVSVADYNNDGNNDILISAYYPANLNQLYSLSGGTYSSITGLNINTIPNCASASWVDYDNDGWLDIYFSRNGTNALYKGSSNGSFTNIPVNSMTTNSRDHLANSWADFDNDGDMDVYCTNFSFDQNEFYRNDGNGSFSVIANQPISSIGGQSPGASWGDYDNDGDLDLYVTNSNNTPNQLYNNNNGNFTLVTSGAEGSNTSMGAAWGDIDNDGDLDIVVGNATIQSTPQSNAIYINNGNGSFSAVSNDDFVNFISNSRGIALADMNHDGYLDVFVSEEYNNPDKLFKNNGGNNNWIKIKLVGIQSNKSAIGARITAYHTINNQSKMQIREVSSQTGYMSQNDLVQHFGLSSAAKLDSIIIRWPSGTYCKFTDIAANQEITYDESCNLVSTNNLSAENDFALFPNPSSNILFVSGKFNTTKFFIYNSQGQLVKEINSEINSDRLTIDISSLSNGVYLLSGDSGKAKRFVISR